MIDDALEIPFELPDPDLKYAHYLETCRRAGVEPVPRERADALMAEWNDTFEAAIQTKH